MSLEVRVGACRSAIETLMGVGDDAKKIINAFGTLMSPNASTTTREGYPWKGPVRVTEEQWWLSRLSLLRNKIMHGNEIAEDMWIYEGAHQLNHIHDRLIRLLRKVLADITDSPPRL